MSRNKKIAGGHSARSLDKCLKNLRLFLAFLIGLGNPAPWVAAAFSPAVRIYFPAFIFSVISSARAFASKVTVENKKLKIIDTRILHLGDDPSDTELLSVRAFEENFVPTSAPVIAGENAALGRALQATLSNYSDEDLSALHSFSISYPQSRWVLAVELNRGLLLYRKGYFSKSVEAYAQAWEAGKNEKTGPAVALADRAVAELMQMYCRVGRQKEAGKLYRSVKDRRPGGKAGIEFQNTEQALGFMKNFPQRSFLCGPYALKNILISEKSNKANDPFFNNVQSPSTGFSLDEVLEFSKKLGMNMQMAKRQPGAKVIVPAVVNWKLGHYAALVGEKNGLYHTQDPTFHNENWFTEKALDEESSGYFLVPEGPLPEGWTQVSPQEAFNVRGKGYSGDNGPAPPCGGALTTDGGGSGTCNYNGMPRTNIDLTTVSAMMVDTPLWYHSAVGPPMDFTLTYHQNSPFQLPFSNFGPDWNFSWAGMVVVIALPLLGGGVTLNYDFSNPGGGAESLVPTSGGSFANTLFTHSGFVGSQPYYGGPLSPFDGMPTTMVRTKSDGSTETFAFAWVGYSTALLLLTKVTDPQGNTVNINYDTLNRISSITDGSPARLTTLFSYGGSDPYKITQIKDPFGRSANFTYDSSGHLQSITDQLGLTSSFTYNPPSAQSADWVGTMTTPYGTTTFSYAGTGDNGGNVRELEITDPMGLKQHVKFNTAERVPEQFPQAPAGVILPAHLGDPAERDTLYWDKNAMANAPLSPTSATHFTWLKNAADGQSYLPASMKKPLESRVWYNYPGQPSDGSDVGITLSEPSLVARKAFDSTGNITDQVWQFSYNTFGNPTSYTDPKGRNFTYTYDPVSNNNIDLVSIQDEASHTLAAWSGYSNHEPSTYTDAAGKNWSLSYNTQGQLTSVQAPLGETTTYHYTSNLMDRVTPPQQGAAVTFSYDTDNRVSSRSDAVNGGITFTYDNGDRVTGVSYPDGTNETYTYDPNHPLDLYSFQDRQQRITAYGYDADRRMNFMVDPKQQTTAYGWCACGALFSITDPKGNMTTFTRDLEGRLKTKGYSDGSSYNYQYDLTQSRLVDVTDPNNQTTQYTYDLDNTLLAVNYSNAKNPTSGVTLTYDTTLPRVVSMSDSTGTNTYNYYSFGGTGGGRLYNISQVVGIHSAAITYAYDDDGRPVTQSIDGTAETYGYTNAELTQVANPLGTFGYNYSSTTAQLTQVTYPNHNQNAQFDYFSPTDSTGTAGAIKDITNSISSTQVSKFSYTYFPTGEVKTWWEQLGNSSAATALYGMGYDSNSELQGVTLTGGTSGFDGLAANQAVTYGYDSAGNRTNETTPLFSHTFGTNSLNQLTNETDKPISISGQTNRTASVTVNGQAVTEDSNYNYNTTIQPASGASTPLTVTEVAADGTVNTVKNHVLNSVPFQYDANGNLLNDGTKSYTWDAANRLISVNILNAQPTTMADTIKMTYDGFGRRVGITELHGATTITSNSFSFVWCGAKLCQERDSSGVTVMKRFYALGEQWVTGNNSGNYYFTFDHLGSVREMVDSTGSIRSRYDYDSYGRQVKQSGDLDADFGYTSFFMNRSSGLDLTWFRAYDSNKGRWLSRDPMGLRAGINLYAYVLNNTLELIDLYGLCGPDSCGVPLPPTGNPWGPTNTLGAVQLGFAALAFAALFVFTAPAVIATLIISGTYFAISGFLNINKGPYEKPFPNSTLVTTGEELHGLGEMATCESGGLATGGLGIANVVAEQALGPGEPNPPGYCPNDAPAGGGFYNNPGAPSYY